MACKSCRQAAGVYGIDDIPYTELAASVVAALATGQIDKAVTKNADGTNKDNFFANNPMAKNAMYLVGGILLTSMEGEMYRGAGLGIATYGGYNLAEGLINQYMPGTTPTVAGVDFQPPSTIGAPSVLQSAYHIPGNYGIAPSTIGQNHYNKQPVYMAEETIFER